SKDFDDYLERPAEGFDVRAQGYLPVYPHLGASVVYEQYFGDEVALFGKDNLQSDPRAVTLGVDYTPFPLATIKVSHKDGQDDQSEAQVDLQLNYQLGAALGKQLDPDNVGAMRSLRGSRYDMVDRNYDIVLEYKEK
ncbi:inverse autotransporter beta domain-containing protein, partial [Yersinia pseudotuberculosis]|uniref:inverse autotransporter beta domain-containing protein n=1 Tax=Yersinia pseudotuberculosis TaxID=633 RepID=UPI0020006EDF